MVYKLCYFNYPFDPAIIKSHIKIKSNNHEQVLREN